MKLKKNIATNDEGFIFNPSTGDSFSTNPIGSEIINLLKQEKTSKEITEILYSKFDVDRSQLEKDLDDFESQLKDFNILDEK